MKKYLLVLPFLMLFASGQLQAAPCILGSDPTPAKVRYGNKIGVWEIGINIGILKVKWTTVRCDGQADVICVEKAGVRGQMVSP